MIPQDTDSAFAAAPSATTDSITVAAADSIAPDTVAPVREVIPVLDTIMDIPAHPAPYLSGHEPAARPYNAASDSLIPGAFAVLLILLLFNLRHIRRLLTSGMHELLSVRRRENVFDDRTANESRAWLVLTLLLFLSAGTLMYFGITMKLPQPPPSTVASNILKLSVLCGCYYIFQFCAYSTVGYAFAPDRTSCAQWIKGFSASFSYLSILIIVPALTALFYPEAVKICVTIAVALFCVAKLVFVIKGFRIFYYNFLSLIYLILYLCSLEIIPLFILYSISYILIGIDTLPIL